MIARIWKSYTKPENADRYESLLKPEILPCIGEAAAFRGSYLLRRPVDDEVEFIAITLWDSLGALKAVTGADYETAVISGHRREYVAHYDDKAAHYEVVSTKGI